MEKMAKCIPLMLSVLQPFTAEGLKSSENKESSKPAVFFFSA